MAKRRTMSKQAKTSQAAVSPDGAPASKQPKKTRILIVDDHPIVRERLAELIHQEPDLLVCGEAEDSNEAINAVRDLRPDLAIVDITLKDTFGIELIKHLKEIMPKLPVLVLSMHDESLYGERALRAGAKGYLTKQDATKKVIPAIRRILARSEERRVGKECRA